MQNNDNMYSSEVMGELLNIIHNAVCVVDTNNNIVFANVRTGEMFRTEVTELNGLPIAQLFMPDDREVLVENILFLTRNEGEFEGEAMLKRPDGTTFLGMVGSNLFSWYDQVKGIALTIHDLTELKKIERQLQRSERIAFLGNLMDDLSHQIRNPVMAIGGFARRLDKEEGSTLKTQAILSESLRLESLLERLNHFIHLRCPVAKSTTIGEIMQKMEQRLGEKADQAGCRLVNEYDGRFDDEMLLADSELLMDAFEEIIVNGCEAYEDSSRDNPVILQLELIDDPVLPYVIRFIDYGRGMDEERRKKCCHHFYSEKTRHVGMGLTLASRIVEEQYGKLRISSEEGKGTIVSIHLLKERRRLIRRIKLTGS